MEDKKNILLETVRAVEGILEKKTTKRSGALEFYEFKYKSLFISIQTDMDKHLETIINVGNRSFTNGSDFISNINEWKKWSRETIETLSMAVDDRKVLEIEYIKKNKYVGGKLEFIANGKKIGTYVSLENNLLPLLKKSRRIEHVI